MAQAKTAGLGQPRAVVERVLFIVNRWSATGHSDATIDRLSSVLHDALGYETELQVEAVNDHPQARARTTAFLAASGAPALIIAGGGGGTLRAVIESVCEGSEPGNLPGRERVRIATLRMGSGNVIARQFGIPLDPEAALKGIVANLHADLTAPCCVMRCEVGVKDSSPEIRYAVTLAGFGQLGRVPGDLARWHHRLPVLHKLIVWLLGIERLTDIEYGLTLFIRFAWCALQPHAAEVVEVRTGERTERCSFGELRAGSELFGVARDRLVACPEPSRREGSMRLLAGVVMNFPLKALPFDPGVRAEDAALSLHFLPCPERCTSLSLVLSAHHLARRALQIQIEGSDRVEICLVDRGSTAFFLDEDPMVFHGRLSIRVAGTLAFVPGPDYQWPQEREERPQ
jgi:hypothetical protein